MGKKGFNMGDVTKRPSDIGFGDGVNITPANPEDDWESGYSHTTTKQKTDMETEWGRWDNVTADDEYVFGWQYIPDASEVGRGILSNPFNPDPEINRLMKANNEKVTRRAKVLTMLSSMGVRVPPRLTVAGGGGGGTSTMTITKPSAAAVDEAMSGWGSISEFETGMTNIVPQELRLQVPAMKGWSDNEIRAYMMSSTGGYAAYLAGGGVPVSHLDNAIVRAYHQSTGRRIPHVDVEHKYNEEGKHEPTPNAAEPPEPETQTQTETVSQEQIARAVRGQVRWLRRYLRTYARIRSVIRFLIRKRDDNGDNDDWEIDSDTLLRPVGEGEVEMTETIDELPSEEELAKERETEREAAYQARIDENARIDAILQAMKEREEEEEEEWHDMDEYDGDDPNDDDDDDDDSDRGGGDPGDDPGDDGPEDENEPDDEPEGEDELGNDDEREAMLRCARSIATYVLLIAIPVGLPASPPDKDCFIRAWNHMDTVREKEKDLIDGIADKMPDAEDDEEGGDDGDDDFNEDINDAFNPLQDPSGEKRPHEEGEEEDPDGHHHKRHRGGHHYPSSRYNTDQEFLFFR